MAALIDTSFLLAAIFPRDANHNLARQTIQRFDESQCIVLEPVLQELFYMTVVRMHYRAAHQYLARIHAASFDIQWLNLTDHKRMIDIMRQYETSAFDYTDVAIMALAERLDIRQVYTFDHRDFSIFRPKHCDYLELLP